jgi:hypothetical protein
MQDQLSTVWEHQATAASDQQFNGQSTADMENHKDHNGSKRSGNKAPKPNTRVAYARSMD